MRIDQVPILLRLFKPVTNLFELTLTRIVDQSLHNFKDVGSFYSELRLADLDFLVSQEAFSIVLVYMIRRKSETKDSNEVVMIS